MDAKGELSSNKKETLGSETSHDAKEADDSHESDQGNQRIEVVGNSAEPPKSPAEESEQKLVRTNSIDKQSPNGKPKSDTSASTPTSKSKKKSLLRKTTKEKDAEKGRKTVSFTNNAEMVPRPKKKKQRAPVMPERTPSIKEIFHGEGDTPKFEVTIDPVIEQESKNEVARPRVSTGLLTPPGRRDRRVAGSLNSLPVAPGNGGSDPYIPASLPTKAGLLMSESERALRSHTLPSRAFENFGTRRYSGNGFLLPDHMRTTSTTTDELDELSLKQALDLEIGTIRFKQFAIQKQINELREAQEMAEIEQEPLVKQRKLEKMLDRKHRFPELLLQQSTLFGRETETKKWLYVRCLYWRATHTFILGFLAFIWIMSIIGISLALPPPTHQNPLPLMLVAGITCVVAFAWHGVYKVRKQINQAEDYKKTHLQMTKGLKSQLKSANLNHVERKSMPMRARQNGTVVVGDDSDDESDVDEDTRELREMLREQCMGSDQDSFQACLNLIRDPTMHAVQASLWRKNSCWSRFKDFLHGIGSWLDTGEFASKDYVSDQQRVYFLQRAVDFVKNQSDRSLLILLKLESQNGETFSIAFFLYEVYSSYIFSLTLYLFTFISIILIFVDSEHHGSGHIEITAIPYVGLEAAINSLFIFSAMMELSIHFYWCEPHNIEISKSGKRLSVAYATLVSWTVLVFIIKATIHLNLDFVVPTRALMPVLLKHTISSTARIFSKSIYRAKHVILLYFIFVSIATCMLFIISNSFEDTEAADTHMYDGTLFAHLGTFIEALADTFIYVSTGENYTNLVYPAANNNLLFMTIYLLIIGIVGIFLLMPVVIAVFQESYATQNKRMFLKKRLFKRLKYAAAFCLLDALNENEDAEAGTVTIEDFQEFIRTLEKGDSDAAVRLFHRLNSSKSGLLDIKEFCLGLEYMFTGMFTVREPPQLSPFRMKTKVIVKSKAYKKFLVFLTMIQVWVISLYGLVPTETLDLCLLFMFFFYCFEVFCRIVGFSWNMYWHPEVFDKKKGGIKRFSNRFELGAVLGAGIFLIIGQALDEIHVFRFGLAFTTTRLLTLIPSQKGLMFSLRKSVTKFWYIFILLFCVSFFYGAIGIILFRDVTDDTNMIGIYGYEARFDTMTSALLTLFQLFVGEAFHEVMYSYAAVTSNLAFIYFVSFVAIVTLLFANLFFGMILTIFAKVYEEKHQGYQLSSAHLLDLLENRQLLEHLKH